MGAVSRRWWTAIRAVWPSGAPGDVLLGLVFAGVALRLIAIVSWWPVITMLDDGYELYATRPFENPLHPGGYSLILGGVGLLTREVAVPILLQHLAGIASALLLYGATRRVTGSTWPGLLPAAIVLLNPDFIYLEHSVMSESWIVLAISAGLYAGVRAFDEPDPWWRWPSLAGAALALGVTIRTAGLLMIPVVVLALLLWRPHSVRRWGPYWRAALALTGSCAVILLAFASANGTLGERFGLGASPGWYLYGRAAQFADCARFTPPAGTEVLCEDRPPSDRLSTRDYTINPSSPAERHFGPFGNHDDLLGRWAKRAILAQPGDYLDNVWTYLRGYWIPGLRPEQSPKGELDPQLAFTNGLDDSGFFPPRYVPLVERNTRRTLTSYYNDFAVHQYRPGLEFLRGWQRVVRFGATLLSIATVLVLLGLLIGARRSRVGVLLFGVGGLALIIAPALTANYWGRYTVPMAGPLMAAAAITLFELWRALKLRRADAST